MLLLDPCNPVVSCISAHIGNELGGPVFLSMFFSSGKASGGGLGGGPFSLCVGLYFAGCSTRFKSVSFFFLIFSTGWERTGRVK